MSEYELQEVLDFIEAELNQRWGETQIDPSTERIAALLDILGNPQNAYPSIHIAGTNGKTSTSRMIDSLARQFSLRIGRNTSPHLQSVTERICIDGESISAERYSEIYQEITPFLEIIDERFAPLRLSKFEVLTAMAFTAFAEAPVDLAIIEVGLGGRWDATNVIESKIAVITPIGLDHTEYLGETLAKIAMEKAGIIKHLPEAIVPEDQIVVTARQEPVAMKAILAATEAQEAVIAREDQEFSVLRRTVAVGGQMVTFQGLGGVYEDVFLPLHGEHQAQNAAVALAAVEAFFGAVPGRMIDVDNVRAGFAQVSSPGRLERIASNPAVFIDAAHNPHGAKALAKALQQEFNFVYTVGVIAILGEKDARGILTALEPVLDEVIITQSDSPRALLADELFIIAKSVFGVERVSISESIIVAIAEAVDTVNQNSQIDPETGERAGGGIIVTGSVVTAGLARSALNMDVI